MNIDDCFYLGYIIKAHGLNGEVSAFFDVDSLNQYKNLESVFVEINEKLIPFFIKSIKIAPKKVILKFEDVNSINDVEALKNGRLFLPLNKLPQLDDDKYYYHELIGFTLIDNEKKELGVVENLIELPHQILMSIIINTKEVLIPLNEAIIKKVSRRNKQVFVDLPEGLIEIYLDENSSKKED